MLGAFFGMAAAASAPAEAAPTVKMPKPKVFTMAHTVKLSDIQKPLVPNELLGGDREFGGNGPRVDSSVTLAISGDQRSIVAKIRFHAKETKSDWSETRGSWDRVVYTAPGGKKIAKILDSTYSSVNFLSKPAGFQLLAPSEDYLKFLQTFQKVTEAVLMFGSPTAAMEANTPEKRAMRDMANRVIQGTAYLISQGNHVHVVAPKSGPVATFAIVGDTGGPDISDDLNPKDDTRIEGIRFKPLRITFK